VAGENQYRRHEPHHWPFRGLDAGIRHPYTDDPVNEFVSIPPVLGAHVSRVVGYVLKVVILFEHRRFVNVVVGRESVFVRVLCEPTYIFVVVAANIQSCINVAEILEIAVTLHSRRTIPLW
jgi:hypothetical protein